MTFFDLHDGLKLALWSRTSLLPDSGFTAAAAMPGATFTLGHNVASAAEVERAVQRARAAGTHVI